MNIAEDIKTILTFYQSLGFERLPLNYSSKFEVQSSKIKDNNSPKSQAQSLKLKDKENSQLEPPQVTRHLSIDDKKAALDALREEIGDCLKCRLSTGRKNIVFGEGDPDAAIMFIGEAPGREEDVQARPFVGEAGQLLTRLIEKIGLKREDVYIGNIVKCRPPQNRDPEEDEMQTCSTFIDSQIGIISPRVIIALGRIASQTLIGTKTPISKLRGRFYEYKGIPVMPTFHPAYLLRNPKDKWLVWEDVQKVMEKLKGGEEQK
ncbi:MAG TPA: uracil-DNA glycosylase [Thermodesulfovibrionales bacterium]|nr:uracil-DNA glycosylase [Thermodesulfovibrionales bacterium]